MEDNFLKPAIMLKESDKDSLVRYLIENVENGRGNPIDTFVMLKFYADAFSKAAAKIEEATAIELAKYGKEKPIIGDWQVATRNGGHTYKYDHDIVWTEIKNKLSEREAQMKAVADVSVTSFDENGIEIPAAVKTPKKDSIVLTKKPK